MQTKTELHQLLRDFRDMTDAQLCSVVSKRGTRVTVGRPTTLSAGELAGQGSEGEGARARQLVKSTDSCSITAEFETAEAAEEARGTFEELVGIVEVIVAADLGPEPPSQPPPAQG